jgi:hypothetical protein
VTMTAGAALAADFSYNLASHDVPEWWLALHGFSNQFDEAALGDPDTDQVPTWAEFYADTIPTNMNSVLALTGVSLDGEDVVVEWKGGVMARQVLSYSGTAGAPSWTPVFTNEGPTAISTNFVHAGAAGLRSFYRITVLGLIDNP